MLYIKRTKHGRGVFSDKSIKEGEIIEVCPVIVVEDEAEGNRIAKTILGSYIFYWPGKDKPSRHPDEDSTATAVVLGFGSLYNHSSKHNALWYVRPKKQELIFYAVRDIRAHEEITHDYGWPDFKLKKEGIR